MSSHRILLIVTGLIFAFCVYEIGSGIYIARTTGILQVGSADKNATITIEQAGRHAANLQSANDKLRLKAGTYTVIASDGKSQIFNHNVVVIEKKSTQIYMTNPVSTTTAVPKNVTIANQLINNLLPFIGPNFAWKVNYTYSFTSEYAVPTIVITAPIATGQQAALSWIKDQGYDPSNLTIKYVTAQP